MVTPQEYAQLSTRVYSRTQPNRIPSGDCQELRHIGNDDFLGFSAGVYRKGDEIVIADASELVISFRGTERCFDGTDGNIATVGLCGCEFYGPKQRTWTEDVQLDAGRTVRVERHVEFTDHNSPARDTYGAYETESTLQLVDAASAPPTWSVPLIRILLYWDSGANEWVIVANTAMCETWKERGSPVPTYWEFRSDGGPWRPKDLSPGSIGRESNLFFDYHAGLPSRRLTVEQKTRILAENDLRLGTDEF